MHNKVNCSILGFEVIVTFTVLDSCLSVFELTVFSVGQKGFM
jgi:hypothetical protein